jgi:hypothetical protein
VTTDSYISDLEKMVDAAYEEWMSIMDEFTGGMFSRGWRPMTDQERIAEWDSLTPEQLQTLRDVKGDSWFLAQAAEIQRLKVKAEGGGK